MSFSLVALVKKTGIPQTRNSFDGIIEKKLLEFKNNERKYLEMKNANLYVFFF